jgi:hypothetical protein
MAIGQNKFFILVTFYLDWGIILVRHQQGSMFGALFNQRLQTANIKYQSKNFPLINSTEVINTSWIDYNSLSIQANNDFQIKNLSYYSYFMKFMEDIKIVLSYGSCSDNMID